MPTFTIGAVGKDYLTLQAAMVDNVNTANSVYELHDALSVHTLNIFVNIGFKITSLFAGDPDNYPIVDHTANDYFNAHNNNLVEYEYFQLISSNATVFHSGQDIGGDLRFTNMVISDHTGVFMDMNGGNASHITRFENCLFRDFTNDPIFTVGSLFGGGFRWEVINCTFQLPNPGSDSVVGSYTNAEDNQLTSSNWTWTNNLFDCASGFNSRANARITVTNSLLRNGQTNHTGPGNVFSNSPDFQGGVPQEDLRINVGSPAEGIGQTGFGSPPSTDISGLAWSTSPAGTDGGCFAPVGSGNVIIEYTTDATIVLESDALSDISREINYVANPTLVLESDTLSSQNHEFDYITNNTIVLDSQAITSVQQINIIDYVANPVIVLSSNATVEAIFVRIIEYTAEATIVLASFTDTVQGRIGGVDHIRDHKEQAKARLIEQYKRKPKVEAMVDALIGCQHQDLEDAYFTLFEQLNINNQVAGQLDQIGTIVGQNRLGLDDESYRIALKGRIGVNNSKGTIENIIQLFKLMTNASRVDVIENYPAEVQVDIDVPINSTIIELAIAFIEQIIAAGVGYGGTKLIDPDNAFAFATMAANDPRTGGFGSTLDANAGGRLATFL